jgi:hypothetical protein
MDFLTSFLSVFSARKQQSGGRSQGSGRERNEEGRFTSDEDQGYGRGNQGRR